MRILQRWDDDRTNKASRASRRVGLRMRRTVTVRGQNRAATRDFMFQRAQRRMEFE
ncbi:BZ3500_MvSof-1268-A1-R1_C094g00513 [Microbotryum saponariae]|uniref:BZ3500_MvSof-1268-A1-R1_C094g00513 protein n=1 Tax=Microbotryum saponariae TaxID=289078 RepID=A0A2X0LX51_9BASI|nr:BZ3500_MvSof-1268-A1-R1_Chr3-3g06632 [Microbotryum saponariae]SDA04043.1 BZ3500_MvSof-1268-A1-R1_C094g00513 [Microbotryum saponariae]SDA04599.1 BZ3501_MvSof-1269-A2-R1_Chr3-2g06319 [Microbotryum saponariae]